MSQVVVREHRPLRTVWLMVAVALLSAIASAAYFLPAKLDDLASVGRLEIELAQAAVDVQRSKMRAKKLDQQVASLSRARQVEVQAYQQVEAHLRETQSQILGLEEEVAFYRGIVASSQPKGINVRKLFLFPGGERNRFQFQLVLTRHMKDDKVLSGAVSLSVVGEQDGKAKTLSTAELLGDSELEFNFKFFHRLEGQFNLPPEFVPRRVHVRVRAQGKPPADTEKAFDWVVTTG